MIVPEAGLNRTLHTHGGVRRPHEDQWDQYGQDPYDKKKKAAPGFLFPKYNTPGDIEFNAPRHGAPYTNHGRAPIRGIHNEYAESEPIVPLLASDQQIDPTDPNCIQNILIQESLTLIELKIQDFQEMSKRARELEVSVCPFLPLLPPSQL